MKTWRQSFTEMLAVDSATRKRTNTPLLVQENPDDLKARAMLLGYFGQASNSEEQQRQYRRHALWVIEHAPRKPIANLVDFLNPKYSDAYEAGKLIWQTHLQNNKSDLSLISNAAYYFLVLDTETAIELLMQGQHQQPHDPKWRHKLAEAKSLLLKRRGKFPWDEHKDY